jgi:hypothetical protein
MGNTTHTYFVLRLAYAAQRLAVQPLGRTRYPTAILTGK